MPRPLWTGAISFGLVTIPVKVVSATEDHDVHFHRVHLADMGRVRTRKVCELDDQVVSQDEIGKGYEIAKDQTVPVTDEELEQMPLPTAKAIEIAAFTDADSIDPVRISDSYYLAADGQVAAKPYALLRKALERSSKVAVAKFAWHGRERLGLLRVREGAIVLHSMKWPDEVRSPESLAPRAVEVGEDEIAQALQLADRMTIEDLSGFRDEYRQALEGIIAAKAEGKPLPAQAEDGKQKQGEIVDLMAALNASVAAAKESRGEHGENATVHEMRPSKKTARKAPAKKTAASKSAAAKKTTGRSSAAAKKTTKKAAAKKRSAS
ncbi:Ku protein [Streptomyces anulatus]|uniref:non-homologous end joining protein Ku n=1 Tax=Streptomyces anulatus TaxID=1892 RepID=UPI00225469ED|nr:Ku protein [Streptomyces anulatus]MCX4524048.1 Ku protein [Streptomyces anulatus]